MIRLNYDTVPMTQLAKRFSGHSFVWIVSDDTDAFLFGRSVTCWALELSYFRSSSIEFIHDNPPRWKDTIMPRAKKTETKENQKSNNWKGFLNIKLDDSEFEKIDLITPNIDLGEYCKWLADFGKVTIAFNNSNDTYNCTVVFSGGRLDGYGISSFSNDFREAVSITAYKIETYHDTVDLSGAASGKARRG